MGKSKLHVIAAALGLEALLHKALPTETADTGRVVFKGGAIKVRGRRKRPNRSGHWARWEAIRRSYLKHLKPKTQNAVIAAERKLFGRKLSPVEMASILAA